MASATPPFWPIKRVSGFQLDHEAAANSFSNPAPFASPEPNQHYNSIQSISPTMLSAPMQIESKNSSHRGSSGLASGYADSNWPAAHSTSTRKSERPNSSNSNSRAFSSADGFSAGLYSDVDSHHLSGGSSLPFSTSFTPMPVLPLAQPEQHHQQLSSPHAQSLSMPIYNPDLAALLAPASNTPTSSAQAFSSSKNSIGGGVTSAAAPITEPDASFYPNYIHESWSTLTPATGKAPSSRSRSHRRSSLGSPQPEDIPKSHIPRNPNAGGLLRRPLGAAAAAASSPAPEPPLASSVPIAPSRPALAWTANRVPSDNSAEHRRDSPVLSDAAPPHAGSAPGSLNPPPALLRDRNPPSPEADGSPKLSSTSDKRKKRRESHNMVERRRRDGINSAIERLSELLPEMLLEPTGAGQTTHHLAKLQLRMASEDPSVLGDASQSFLGAGSGSANSSNVLTTTLKPNKAVVLSKTVEYVQHLQELVQLQARRNSELEASLGHYRSHSSPSSLVHQTATSPLIGAQAPAAGPLAYDEELFDMTSNMELS